MNRTIWLGALLFTQMAACAPSPEGSWRSRNSIRGERNDLRLDEDERGSATLFFYGGDEFYTADFSLTWSDGDKSTEVDLTCDGNCAVLDFRMDCTLSSDGEKMDCDGEDPFRGYDFEWERQ